MAGQNPGSPTDFQYFYDDEVFKINNRGQVVFGLVLENYEANSSDQESDVETPIQKGEIRVVWHPTGTERVISEKSVGLADRSLMPGDVVRRLVADSQRGYCRDIHMTASMQIVGTNHVIQNVNSARLQPLEEYTPDLAVCLDSWVGTSDSVQNRLRLVSNDGSCLEYPVDSCPLEDYSTHSRRFMQHAMEYYPGQIVYGPVGLLQDAYWINVTKEMKTARKHKMHEHKFTVEAVMTDSVNVHWQCRALSTNTEDPPQQPKFVVEGEDLKRLKLLNVFESCTLQVGDRNYLTISPEDTFITKKQWKKKISKYYRNLRKEQRMKKHVDKPEGNTDLHVPHRSKKRSTSHRKLKNFNVLHAKIEHADDVKLESLDENMEIVNSTREECLDDELKTTICPSIKVEITGEQCLSMTSQEDCVEEKNDSGISPEPNKEENLLLNGDSKWFDTENPDDDDDDNWENTSSEGSDTDSGATWSSRCSSRGKRSPLLAVRLLRGKRLRRAPRRALPRPPPLPGQRVVVETLHTLSWADVVWQDGSTEERIVSTKLYPIHHLDGQECFPGDLVVDGTTALNDTQIKHREYGVVQRVDHHGRTAIVHWYRTYTSAEEPIPQMLYESEMSVYDLKDHPNFQFRPGTVVIRVANFTGEDANCTAGQVIDNFPSGRVKVWWVDGHTSMCWPQDLYKVGEYDSEEGELWASEGSASEDSWETQSSAHDADKKTEDNTPTTEPIVTKSACCVPRLLEPRVAQHMQRGREALQRLQEMFHKQPALQNQEIMRKLLNLYKDCRFLDKLMGTHFFHEDHFLGLIERVRERGATTPSAGEQRVHEQLTKLFTPTEETDKEPNFTDPVESDKSIVDSNEQENSSFNVVTDNKPGEPMEVESVTKEGILGTQMEVNVYNIQASGSNFPEHSKIESGKTCPELKDSAGSQSSNVCYKLCSLIHTQLVKAHAEISRRRPTELAEFLNGLMKNQSDAKEKLPYHFSVQYGALVVSMAEKEAVAKNEAKSTKDTPNEVIVPENIFAESGFPKAPLATVESDLESERAEGFTVLESAPLGHRFRLSMLQPSEPKSFYSAVKREIKLLKSDLPPGVWVRGYEDRIDLLSLMIAGPAKTPYEGGIFLFDVQLGGEYPRAPPLCHYHSYCTDRLNPNLYEDGKVCVSLLGTWSGRGVEVWGKDSSLLQVIVSLQGLILNSEPYFNEAGYEKQKGTQQGIENSRMYNEMVLLKLVQSMTKMLFNPPEPFKYEILEHLKANSASMCRRLEDWVHLSNGKTDVVPPEFPLVPASRGFCLTLNSSLEAFRNALKKNDIEVSPSTL